MKRFALTLCILSCGIPWALADDLVMDVKPSTMPHTILGGVVRSISWADPVKGTKSEIVVTNAAGKKINILVTPNTTLWDADAKAVMADKIVSRSHVNVIYLTTPEGLDIAKSIKILK